MSFKYMYNVFYEDLEQVEKTVEWMVPGTLFGPAGKYICNPKYLKYDSSFHHTERNWKYESWLMKPNLDCSFNFPIDLHGKLNSAWCTNQSLKRVGNNTIQTRIQLVRCGTELLHK